MLLEAIVLLLLDIEVRQVLRVQWRGRAHGAAIAQVLFGGGTTAPRVGSRQQWRAVRLGVVL